MRDQLWSDERIAEVRARSMLTDQRFYAEIRDEYEARLDEYQGVFEYYVQLVGEMDNEKLRLEKEVRELRGVLESAAWQRMRQADYVMDVAIDALKEEESKVERIKQLEYELRCARGRRWLRNDAG